MNGAARGYGGALFATVAWGGMFPIFPGMLTHLDPFWLTSIRYGTAALILLGILALVEGREAFRLGARPLSLVALGIGGYTFFNLFVLVGVQRSGAHHGALIVATTPLLTVLILWARTGIRPPVKTLGWIALAFAGVALVVTKGDFTTIMAHGSGSGDLAILFGVLSFAGYSIGSASFRAWSPLRFTALTAAAGAVVTIAITFIGTLIHTAHLPSIGDVAATAPGMAYLILFGAVLALMAWNLGLKILGAQRAVLFMNAVPVTTFAIEIARGAHFAPVEYFGAALTIFALTANNLTTASSTPSAPRLHGPVLAELPE